MEIRTLQYFLTIAREESISGAAEYLHVTQPTLSRQMKELEEELGKQLFIRGKRRITLTDEGMILRKRA
ncbi:LysR family transcriptional regulator, partial [Mediterraneibacter gnavus]